MDFNSFSYWFTKINRITKTGQLNMYPVFFVVDISSETQQYFCVHDLILQTHEQIYACYKKSKKNLTETILNTCSLATRINMVCGDCNVESNVNLSPEAKPLENHHSI